MHTGTACYLMTSQGTLMPGIFEGIDSTSKILLFRISSPNGREYSCNPDNVLDSKTGYGMLLRQRGEQLISKGYDIKLRDDNSLRIFQASRHTATGGYLLRMVESKLQCNCPSAKESATGICKHILGAAALAYAKARQCEMAGKSQHAATWNSIAERILYPSEFEETSQAAVSAPSEVQEAEAEEEEYQGCLCALCGLPAHHYDGDGNMICFDCDPQ